MTTIVKLACGCSKELDDERRIVDVRLCQEHVSLFTWLDFNNLQPETAPPMLSVSVTEIIETGDKVA